METSLGVWENLAVIGGMFYVYAIAQLLNLWKLNCENDKSKNTLEGVLCIICIVLWVVSFPVSLIMLGINYFYKGHMEQIHTKELIEKSNKDYARIKETTINPLMRRIDELEQENARLRRQSSGN